MKMMFDALFYPLRGSGWIMVMLGTLLSVVFHVSSNSPILGLPVAIFGGGYFVAFFFEIVTSTVNREEDCANWPSISQWWDLIPPVLRFYGALLVSFLPALGYTFWLAKNGEQPDLGLLGCLGFGALYFPMAILGIIEFGSFTGALPHIVMPAIFRSLPGYLFALVALAVVVALPFYAEKWSVGIRYWHWVISPAISLYGMMAEARFIGLLYVKYEERIGWF
jgi:hypothetical protein